MFKYALNIRGLALAFCGLFLFSCAYDPNDQSPEEIIDNDLQSLYVEADLTELTLEDAIMLALENNLDAKIAEQDYVVSLSDADLQKLNALPTITAKQEFIGRSNPGASSSFSVLTGARSLEPSISTDQYRWVSLLEMNWNVLDSAINIYRSKSAYDQAVIAQERYRKVRQNIIMDLYSVYWKLVAYQMLESSIADALVASDEKLEVLEYAEGYGDMSYNMIGELRKQITGKRKRLMDLQREKELAELQFKALLSIPPDREITLAYDEAKFEDSALDAGGGDFDALVKKALMQRPEIREELLNLKISERNVNAEILQTLPGLNVILGLNYDENSYLEDASWLSLTSGITQSITKLLTLPARREKAENEVDFANIKRKALVAAVISQVHIARIMLDKSYEALEEERRSFDFASKVANRRSLLREGGLVSGWEDINSQLQYEIEKIEYYNTLVDVHAAQARLINSVGHDLENVLDLMLRDHAVEDDPFEEVDTDNSETRVMHEHDSIQ